jgi:predicted DCC family thiol-disulfide oxidoreductase YuxK
VQALPLTVYYDASCPLCRAEMDSLRRHDAGARLDFIDCSAPGFADADARAAGIGREAMMSVLHVRDARGVWHRGIPAFALVYRTLGLDGVAAWLSHPRLQPAWTRGYRWLAAHRQWLSRPWLVRLFGWAVERAARRAARRMRCEPVACAAGKDRNPA